MRYSLQRLSRPWAVGVVLVFLLGACAGSGDPDSTGTDTGSTATDTTSADSSTAGDRTDGSDLRARPAPPPGTVEVRAVVETCTSDADGMQCTLAIRSVLRTGMSTPVMAAGRRTVWVQQHVADAYADDGLPRETPRDLRLSAPSESLGDASDTPMWTLVRVL
ncbi:hypothetical protein [Longibacter salinarum]|nr:hypothetical protein [Longibacter salinarum]